MTLNLTLDDSLFDTENRTSTNDSNSLGPDGDSEERYYSPLFGMEISMPEWEALMTIVALGLVIIITIIGEFVKIEIPHFLPKISNGIYISKCVYVFVV